MRRDQHRGMIHQRVAGRRRLGLEDVDRGAGDLALVEGLGQRGLVDQAAPGAVDDPHRGLHPGDLGGADDVAGLGGHRRVQRQEVAAGPQVIQPLDALDAQLLRLVGGQEGVEADDRHPEPLRPLRHRQPDPAQPDDAQGLALELRAGELVPVPLARFQAGVGLGDVPRQREQQRHGVLGRGDRVAARRVHHHDPAPGRRRHVDVVDPHAGAHDRLEPRLALEHVGGQLRARPDHDPVGLGQRPLEGRHVLRELGVDHHLDPRLGPQPLQTFLGQLVRHQYPMRHDRSPCE